MNVNKSDAGDAQVSGRSALLVGAGVTLSRLSGLIRELVLAGLLGTRIAADAFKAALQIPGLLQNILGEGTLSASFVPVYSRLVDEDRQGEHDAGVIAGVVLSALALLTGVVVFIGIIAARPITKLLLPVLPDATFELTVDLVRVMWAGLGFIVLSAWCLGVLNSHRKFFLSFAAPIAWNAAQIFLAIFAWANNWDDTEIAKAAAWGVLIGGFLQFAIQLPAVFKVAPSIRASFRLRLKPVQDIFRRFTPALLGRGVIQLSAFLDLFLAGFLAAGAFAGLSIAQIIYLLPIGIFAMSIVSADLPELSRDQGNASKVINRIAVSQERIAFYVAFSAVAFFSIGKPLIGALFERGDFTEEDTLYVWLILCAYSFGLFTSSISRLYQNACYAAGDTKGPARFAALRVCVSGAIGVILMFQFDRFAIDVNEVIKIGNLPAFSPLPESIRSDDMGPQALGAVGLALGSACGSWVEYARLKKRMASVLPSSFKFQSPLVKLLIPLLVAGSVGAVLAWTLNDIHNLILGPSLLAITGMLYVYLSYLSGSETAKELLGVAKFRRKA